MGAPRYRLTHAWLRLTTSTLPMVVPAAVGHLHAHPDRRLCLVPAGQPPPGGHRALLLDIDPDTQRIRAAPADPWRLGRTAHDAFDDPAWMTQAAHIINALQGEP